MNRYFDDLAESGASEPTWSDVKTRIVESALWIPDDADASFKKNRRAWSQRRALLNDVVDAAATAAQLRNHTPSQFEYDFASKAVDIVDRLQGVFVQGVWGHKNWNFWKRQEDPFKLIMGGKEPYIDRTYLEDTAAEYLTLPFRSRMVERLLVDALVAVEMFAFGSEMVAPRTASNSWLPSRSALHQRHVLTRFVIGQFWSAVVFLGVAFAIAGVFPTSSLASGISIALVGLYLFLLVADVLLLPFAWKNQRRDRARIVNLMREFVATYSELAPSGAISARRIREVASKASDKGVVWPGSIFAILDDNIARDGSL